MVDELRGRGFPASREPVERLMRENGIRARHKRRYKATTDSKHSLPIAPNLAGQELHPGSTQPCLDIGHHLHLGG
jgi:putative transposase